MNDTKKRTLIADSEPIEADRYEFEELSKPAGGFPELQWRGKQPFRSTRYYPAHLKEVHGPKVSGWRNRIYWGDNLQAMSHLLREFRGKVGLIYIDPPFDSKVDYKKRIRLKSREARRNQTVLEERQYSDSWADGEYLQFLYERLILLRELLADNGSIYVHLDWRVNHFVKVILDEVFGQANFRNEIVWRRTTAHSDARQGARSYGRQHDTLLFYTKSPNDFVWNQEYVPYDRQYIEQNYRMVDEKGRRFQAVDMTAARPGGDTLYEWKGYRLKSGKYWAYSKENMKQFDNEGRIYYTSSGLPRLKYYLDEMPGVPVQDLWMEIKILSSQSNERVDYPTQKPESLLERIVKVSSNPGDIVFDCFMGSGTTQAVAMKLGRRFIGADINLGAIQTATRRLIRAAAELTSAEQRSGEPERSKYTGFEIYNIQSDESKREAEARVVVNERELVIENFYPMNLLRRLSMTKESVEDWREMVESVMVDWNYDGVVLHPAIVDLPGKNGLVKGRYRIPEGAGTTRVKITDLLSESLEVEVCQ